MVFTLDRQRYALPLSVVERVVRMIEITPVPHTPDIVLGVINAQGRVIPVVDIRRRFRLPTRQRHGTHHKHGKLRAGILTGMLHWRRLNPTCSSPQQRSKR